ncbi:hypothetical protein [Streptosporangium amethystogenes]|uniref:baeRF10 domain-containing protein n=1 Tax=Streptosporangium amethystogenes TaxID=2002 RepID=UPI0004C47FEC|nr:hypothetical protein [Streptosporangium amethystogenes]
MHAAVEGTLGWLGDGVAVFAAHARGLFERLRLPSPVPYAATMGTKPYLRPLITAVHRCHLYCIAVVDEAHAWIWISDNIAKISTITDEAPRKPNFAGWYGLSEHRVRSRTQGLRVRHYRNVAAAIGRTMGAEAIDLLVLGAHEHEIPLVVHELPACLRARVAGHFVVDPSTLDPGKVKPIADHMVASWLADHDEKLVAEVAGDAAAGDHAVIGLAGCLAAVNARAVRLLLVDDRVRVEGVGFHA